MRSFGLLLLWLSLLATCKGHKSMCQTHLASRWNKIERGMEEMSPSFMELFNASKLFPFGVPFTVPWDNLFRSLLSPNVTDIWYFGGSMIAGSKCKEGGLEMTKCAYPARMELMLNFLFSKESFNPLVVNANNTELMRKWSEHSNKVICIWNRAKAGTSTDVNAPLLPQLVAHSSPTPSALFLDFSVNDGLLSNVQFNKGKNKTTPILATESLILYMKKHFPHLPIFFVEARCTVDSTKYYELKKQVLERHGVPLISYRDAAGGPKECVNEYVWGKDTKHPPAPVHRNVAYAVVKAMLWLAEQHCTEFGDGGRSDGPSGRDADREHVQYPALLSEEEVGREEDAFARFHWTEPVYSEGERANVSVCTSTMVYDSYDWYENKGGVVEKMGGRVRGDWKLYEDVSGKPGWIGTKKGSVMEFDVEFGERPGLFVGFLRSYEKVGDALMSIKNGELNRQILLEGHHNDHTSVTFTYFTNAATRGFKNTIASMLPGNGFGIKPYSKETLRFETTSDAKFKLLYIVVC